jgi:hypothetical protein
LAVVDDDLVPAAAMNNAMWCDAVCRAQGLGTEYGEHTWVCLEKAPPLYPNLVSLSANGVEIQRRRIGDLTDSLAGWGWAVMDSFNALDLVRDGFQPMFHGPWMILEAARSETDIRGVFRVQTRQELEAWEGAWTRHTGRDQGVSPFRVGLLDDPDVAFLIARRDSQTLGGFIANRGGGVVGVTNVFAKPGAWSSLWPCLAVAEELWPDLPLVSGGGDDNGQLLHRLGFRELRAFKIWAFVDQYHDC